MRRLFIILAAIVIVLVGAVLLPLPIPLGAPMLAGGLIMLISASPAFAKLVSFARQRWQPLNRGLTWLELHIPAGLAAILRRTR